MTDYQRGDVVFANGCVWLWIEPPGMAGEFVNSYGQMCSAEAMEKYQPLKVIKDGRVFPQVLEETDESTS